MLESTATKREAKAYLSRFSPRETKVGSFKSLPKRSDNGVNLGDLYPRIKAVKQDPGSSHRLFQPRFPAEAAVIVHVALIIIRNPQSLDEKTRHGVSRTISQLSRLGLSCVVVVDCHDDCGELSLGKAQLAVDQADNIVEALEDCGGNGARRVDGVLGVSDVGSYLHHSIKVRSGIRVAHRNLLLAPLRRGIIPVIVPTVHLKDTQKLVCISANEVVLALTRDLAGIQDVPCSQGNCSNPEEKVKDSREQAVVQRVIVLDPLGGIPSLDNKHGSHVSINLEQEFDGIKNELIVLRSGLDPKPSASTMSWSVNASTSESTTSHSVLKSPASDMTLESGIGDKHQCMLRSRLDWNKFEAYIQNLELFKDALAVLPPSSSGFLATPQEVSTSGSPPSPQSQEPAVRTRRQRNPLIHNWLTDRPVSSSSLPSSRLSNTAAKAPSSTYFKRGMPVTLIPDPHFEPWQAPERSTPSISLSDPRIDLPRLVNLIEDSFGRKLDVKHYCERLRTRLAGVIIAGEYEGGAILTWETPSNAPPDDPRYRVPYLDKFAVLKRSQGSGVVADIVFNAMVRECFPSGVCWRSRKSNPVNSWYFERAKGVRKLPDSDWTMFWTTEGVWREDHILRGYDSVCREVTPSWADREDITD